MKGIGKWTKLNGEALYGTRRYSVYGEGETELTRQVKIKKHTKVKWNLRLVDETDVRFLQKNNTLYAISLQKP